MTSSPSGSFQGRWVLPFLGVACAVGVGSLYYNQPLLLVMGASLHQSAREMGFVAVATQVGYAFGILSFVPLGDVTDRRKLMMRLYAGVALSLGLAACAHTFSVMMIASILIGLTASVTHVVVPMAPELVPPERRGQAIGTVMTGLLLGILLARSFAGWVANVGGWRTVYAIAAVMNAAFVPLLFKVMPSSPPRQKLTYVETLRSLWTMFRSQPLLREAGVVGGLCFAAFSSFWTTLTFVLHQHHGMGPGAAGTFGVVGAAGALIAPVAGRLADRRGTRFVISAAGAIMTACLGWIWLSEAIHAATVVHMALLVFGVVGLDLGMQALQVGNQTRIFGLGESSRSRLNTLYMTMYFVGGATGSALASIAWNRWEWTGVCLLEIALVSSAGLVHAFGYSRSHAALPTTARTREEEPA